MSIQQLQQQQQQQQQHFGLTPTGMTFVEQHKGNSTFTPFNNNTANDVIPSQSIPSPPGSIPDQQQQQLIYNQQIGMPSPNTSNRLFDHHVLNDQHLVSNITSDFNGHDAAAAVVAAAEQHMHQQQQIMMIQQQQQQQQQQNISFLYNQQDDGNTTTKTNPISLHHEMIDPKQFDDMSREQLIARLVTLEKEKHANTEDKSVHSDNTTDEEEVEPLITEHEKMRTCLWADCGEKFDGLQKLISHITEIHVGGGKPTYRCEWENCPRNNKPFTKRHKMYNHLRTHTGERPFACPKPDCDKKFSRPDSLTTHIKTHSNVRPFVCSFRGCGKAYYHSRSLKKHEKIHEITIDTSPQAPPPSYEQVMATTPILTSNTPTSTINTIGLVPTSLGHLVDPNAPFYGEQQQQPSQPFISTPVPFPFSPHDTTSFNNSNFIMNPNMNSIPMVPTNFMATTTSSLVQDHQ